MVLIDQDQAAVVLFKRASKSATVKRRRVSAEKGTTAPDFLKIVRARNRAAILIKIGRDCSFSISAAPYARREPNRKRDNRDPIYKRRQNDALTSF